MSNRFGIGRTGPIDFSIEDLKKVLDHKNISMVENKEPDEFFDREMRFVIDGECYKTVWWVNVSYLEIGVLLIPFRYVKQESTWPNNAKLNLQFYNDRNEIVCILPIEYWPNKKK